MFHVQPLREKKKNIQGYKMFLHTWKQELLLK